MEWIPFLVDAVVLGLNVFLIRAAIVCATNVGKFFDCLGALSNKYDIHWKTKQLCSFTVYSGAVFFDFSLFVCCFLFYCFFVCLEH